MEQYVKKNNLDGQRENAHVKGKANLDKVLLWTYKWGWVTELVLQKLLNVTRRPGAYWCKRGILTKIEPPAGHVVAYVIKPGPHLSRALELYEEDSDGLALPYPYPRTSIPFAALGEHNEKSQLIALDELRDGEHLTTEREMRDGSAAALPDFAITDNNGLFVHWHEVELTAKYHERLLFQLEERETARKAGRFDKLVWWCRTPGIARNLRKILSQKALPKVKKRADGRIVKYATDRWNPAELAEATEINVIGQPKGVIPEGGQRLLEESEAARILDLL